MKLTSIPFCKELPNNWQEIPNKYLFEYHSSLVGDNWKNYQLLSLTTSGVKEKDINAGGGKVPDSYNKYQTVEPGDIVFCLFDLDVSAVFSGLSHNYGMITSAYDVVRAHDSLLDQSYCDFWFRYVFSNRYYKIYSKNIRFTIGTDMFKSIKTPVPPIETQKRIGAFLNKKTSEIDSLIEIENKQIEKLLEYKRSLITQSMTIGIDNDATMKKSHIEWVKEIPQDYKEAKLKTLSYIRGRLGWKGLKAEEYQDEGFGFIGTPNIDDNGSIDWESCYFISKERYDESPEIMLSPGDVLLTKDGAGIGKCAFVRNVPFPSTINSSLALVTCGKEVLGEYLFYYFKTKYFFEYINRIKGGMGVPHLFQSDLREIVVPIPPVEKQRKIIDYLNERCSTIESIIQLKRQQIALLNGYKRSIIYELVTGKKSI